MLQLPELYQNVREIAYITVTLFQSIDRCVECLLLLTICYLRASATLKISETNCVRIVSVKGKVS